MSTIDSAVAGQEAGRADRSKSLPTPVLRSGAVCAILGSVVSVIAGAQFDNLTVDTSAQTVLEDLATRPEWSWPLVGLTFVVGALLWLGAFVVIAGSLRRPEAAVLGQVAVAAIILGTTVHVIDAAINAGLSAIAQDWSGADDAAKHQSLMSTDTVLNVLAGTWPAVVMLFHGVPFLIMGVAVSLDDRYPRWSGWLGVVGGVGSIALGGAMFLGSVSLLYIVFAIAVSIWMVLMGVLLWIGASRFGDEVEQSVR